MGRWSQARRRGTGGPTALPAPILEEDWDAFDGSPMDPGDIDCFRHVEIPVPADELGIAIRQTGTSDAFEFVTFSDASEFHAFAAGVGLDYDVKACWCNAGTPVSPFSEGTAHVISGG